MAANLEKMLADNRAQVAVLSNPAATPEAVAAASQALAATNPAEVEKTIKSLGTLQVEYNGKLYGDGKTLKMNPESLEGIIQGQSDIPLSCGFFLKNGVSAEAISWELKTSSGATLPLEAPLRISATSNSEYLGIKWPDGQAKLKLTATSGSRKVTLNLEKPVWNLSDLQVADGNRIAKAGEILYLVKAPAKDEKATISWKSDVEPSLLKNYFYADGKNPTGNFSSNKITYNFSNSPNTTTYRMNALGYDKTVKVEVVNEDREKKSFSAGSETFGKEVQQAFELSKSTQKIADVLDKVPFLKRVKNKADKDASKISWYYNVTPFENNQLNKEDSKSPKYYRERTLSGGFEAGVQGTVEWPVWGIPFNKLPLPDAWIDNIEKYIKAEVVIKGKADMGGELKFEQIGKQWVNTTTWENEKFRINPAVLRLKGEFGAEAEVSLLKDFSLFSIGALASGMANAEILTIGYYEGNFQWGYFREGVNLDAKITGYVTTAGVKSELTPIFKRFEIYKK